MENKEVIDTLHDIKDLMERSTKFLSISGISSIFVGIYACIGTGLAYFILNKQGSASTLLNIDTTHQLSLICTIALVVLALSLITAFTMSYHKAKKVNRYIFKDKSVHRLLWNFFLPLFAGGILCFSLIWQQHYGSHPRSCSYFTVCHLSIVPNIPIQIYAIWDMRKFYSA